VNVAFPFRFDDRGATALAGTEAHVLQMLEQLLFTNAGERVMRPDLGSGLLQLPFSPNTPEVAGALRFSMQAAIQQWLGDVIEVRELTVESEEATLRIDIAYVLRESGEAGSTTLVAEVGT
jgi:phage baseplate assembly protein W